MLFGQLHLVDFIHLSEKMMVGLLVSDPKIEFLDGLPSLSKYQQRQVQESKEIHRRSDLICIAVFQQGGFAGKEQPLNSLAWKEPFSQQFLEQCSCYMVATPACKWGLDFFKYWAIAATSDRISTLTGHCSHKDHMDFRGKRLPDGSYVCALTAEYPPSFASAVIDILSPWTSKTSLTSQDLSTWRTLLSRNPISQGPRITDGAGDISSANWTIPRSKDFFKSLRQTWIKRILQTKLHTKIAEACKLHQAAPFLTEEDIHPPFLNDFQDFLPTEQVDLSILDHQPFRLKLLHTLLLTSEDPDPNIATLLQEGIPSGAFSTLQPVGLWEANKTSSSEYPDLVVCQDNWTSANHDPEITRRLIQAELDDGFIEELPTIAEAECRWPKGIALGKLGVVHADNRDPRLVLDSTICGMNGRCHLPERQKLSVIYLSSCPPVLHCSRNGRGLRSILRQRTRECSSGKTDERGSLLFRFDNRLFAYRSAHFGAKTSAWHWGRVSGALLRLLHSFLYFRHAAWVYVDDFFLLFPKSTSSVQFTLAVILLRALGTALSW